MPKKKVPAPRKAKATKSLTYPERRSLRAFSGTMSTAAFKSQLAVAQRQANLSRGVFSELIRMIDLANISPVKKAMMNKILEQYRT